jgi:hypothetical protein
VQTDDGFAAAAAAEDTDPTVHQKEPTDNDTVVTLENVLIMKWRWEFMGEKCHPEDQ